MGVGKVGGGGEAATVGEDVSEGVGDGVGVTVGLVVAAGDPWTVGDEAGDGVGAGVLRGPAGVDTGVLLKRGEGAGDEETGERLEVDGEPYAVGAGVPAEGAA